MIDNNTLKILLILNIIYLNIKCDCPNILSVQLDDNDPTSDLNKKIYGVDFSANKTNYFVENGTTYGCICNLKQCVRKCCGPSEIMKDNACTFKENFVHNYTFHDGTNPIQNYSFDQLHFIYNEHCDNAEFRIMIDPRENDEDKIYLQKDGRLLHINTDEEKFLTAEHYCIEYFEYETSGFYTALRCYLFEETEEADTTQDMMYRIGMIISMPFLLATLIVYALLPERNLHMKALMFYVFSLLMAYICLVILQLNTKEIPKTECQVIAFFTFFFFMASFFWMNVICLDIWFTFSGLRGFNGSKRSAERKRLLFYCAYAWGLTIALSTTVFLINNLGNAGAWYHPNIGNGRCWFEHDYQQLFYFYGPMAVLIFANVVLFCLTAYKIRQSQNETKMLRRDDSKRHAAESDQQKFYLYMKLFLAMGVNWTMEFLSWIIEWKVQAETKYMFYVTDFCNAIYGVFIFFLFVCKMKIWCLLKKRYYTFMGKPYFARETTLRTHSSNFSGTESTMFSDNDHNRDSRPLRLNSMK